MIAYKFKGRTSTYRIPFDDGQRYVTSSQQQIDFGRCSSRKLSGTHFTGDSDLFLDS